MAASRPLDGTDVPKPVPSSAARDRGFERRCALIRVIQRPRCSAQPLPASVFICVLLRASVRSPVRLSLQMFEFLEHDKEITSAGQLGEGRVCLEGTALVPKLTATHAVWMWPSHRRLLRTIPIAWIV